jgi:hypothetical protein
MDGMSWQNVTRDEMSVAATAYPPLLATGDLTEVRELFRGLLLPLNGALIACDMIEFDGVSVIRTLAKYRPATGSAMTYVGALTVPVASHVIELSIRASERRITGVREALVVAAMSQTAGISEREQLARKVMPVEWKFERYHPGSRGDVAYLVSDDEKYDAEYPDHPLSRVRRSLRRIERTFRVTVDDADGRDRSVQLRQPDVRPMGAEEVIRELGFPAFADAMAVEAARKNGHTDVALEIRQKAADDLMTASLKKKWEESARKPATGAIDSFLEPSRASLG